MDERATNKRISFKRSPPTHAMVEHDNAVGAVRNEYVNEVRDEDSHSLCTAGLAMASTVALFQEKRQGQSELIETPMKSPRTQEKDKTAAARNAVLAEVREQDNHDYIDKVGLVLAPAVALFQEQHHEQSGPIEASKKSHPKQGNAHLITGTTWHEPISSDDDLPLWISGIGESEAIKHEAAAIGGPSDVEAQGTTVSHVSGTGDCPDELGCQLKGEGLQNDIENMHAIPSKKWHQQIFVCGMLALGFCAVIGLITGIVFGRRSDTPVSTIIESTFPPSSCIQSTVPPSTTIIPSSAQPLTMKPTTLQPSTLQPSTSNTTQSLEESQIIACDFIGISAYYGYSLIDCFESLSVSLPDFYNEDATTIPTAIGVLTQLTSLTIDPNLLYGITFTGIIPSSIGRLTNLEHLSINGQSFSRSSLPTSMINLTQLTNLPLTGVELTGAIPSWIGSLTKLTTMSLSTNFFQRKFPKNH